MLSYKDLTSVEKHMVDTEIESNFNTSAKNRTQYETMLETVHSGARCCNCFRSVSKCCCDKLEDCFDEPDEYN